MTAGSSPTRLPFGGIVYCHAPADEPFELEELSRDPDPADRWSIPRTPMAYLASTPAVAAAEWARHAGADADHRQIVALELRPVPMIDLRDGPPTGDGSAAGPLAYLDRDIARRAATDARRAGAAGILVPSVAFPDRSAEAFNIVLYCDALPGGIRGALAAPRPVGRICIDPAT
jgi:hypothetical protein